MTPTELCALAEKIDAAVPGLVYLYDISLKSPDEVCGPHYNMKVHEAAAMMLGLCWAWLQQSHDKATPDRTPTDVIECYLKLRDFVQSTIPEAP